jgi:DNA processing protein
MNLTLNNQTALHCSLIKDIGPAIINRLLQDASLQTDFSQLYSIDQAVLSRQFGLSYAVATKLIEGLKDRLMLENELRLLDNNPSIHWLSILDDAYPALLKEIHHPPIGFYYRGNLPDASQSLAIVGARKASHYAQRIIDRIIPELVAHGWAIVSGGARGVDSMAHSKTVEQGGKTIAVLGSGLLRLYPRENKKLFDAILSNGGTVMSPFSLETPPLPNHFPIRNRIISGLSKGSLVVQAAQKSGSLITAHWALEQGREVFAVPGPIDDPLSVGCHNLIGQGAKLVSSAHDITSEFGYEREASSDYQSTIFMPVDPILSYCENPISIDELSKKTGQSVSALQAYLIDLQLDGKIQQNFAGLWSRL